MNRIDRLFGILTLLQSKKYVPAEKIADKFQISVRTVYRDIKALSEQGIPVSFEQPRGYFIVQGYFLPPVAFTSEEANALLLMESIVYGFTDKSIQTNYTSAEQSESGFAKHPERKIGISEQEYKITVTRLNKKRLRIFIRSSKYDLCQNNP